MPVLNHPETTPAEVRRPVVRRDAATILLGAAAGAAVSWLTADGLIDDTYITLAYARNLAEHGHWGMTPGMTSNAATSPLNVLLLAASTTVLRPVAGVAPVLALCLLTTLLAAFAAWCLGRAADRLGLPRTWPVVAVVAVLLNPFVISAVGLEVVLLATCMAALLAAGLAGRPVLYGLAAGAALLARLDMVVFVVVLALACAGIRRRLPAAVAVCSAVALPWFAASWWWLGSAIPDTFVIKTLQHSFGEGRTYLRGLWTHYFPLMPVAVWVAVVPAAVGLLVLLVLLARLPGRRRPLPAGTGGLVGLGLAGVAYFTVYSRLGVPPYQWYYVPPMASLTVVAVLGTGVLLPRRRGGRVLRAWPVVVVPVVAGGLVAAVPAAALPLPWAYPPVFGNFATPQQYRTIGLEVGERVGEQRVASPGEIGTLAYYCRCEIVDAFSDPTVLQPQIDQRIADADPVLKALLEANYHRRDAGPVAAVPFTLQWIGAGATPPPGATAWETTAGTFQREDLLVLRESD